MCIEPSFKLFKPTEHTNVKASCKAPKRAEALPDCSLKGESAKVVAVGNIIPKGITNKGSIASCK